MRRWIRGEKPTRAELIDRKHRLSGEIRAVTAALRRLEAQNGSTARLQGRLEQLQNLQYQTRQEIDRAEP